MVQNTGYNGAVDVYTTFWKAGHHHLVCADCQELAADLLALSIHESSSGKDQSQQASLDTVTSFRVRASQFTSL